MTQNVASTLRLGVIGLGRAFTLMLPTFVADKRIRLVAATDPIEAATAQFEKDFDAPTHASAQALCADPRVQAVYVASPHQFHAEHVCLAAAHGKHVLVEKPMALTLDECTRMIDACHSAGVHLIVGHSHSFNAPIKRTRELIASGAYGDVKMITALNFTDFLYRPRRPEELETSAGGGVIHSQGAHQIDIIRLLGGGLVKGVQAQTGNWDSARPTEGAYSALLAFESGAFASATYSGYGHYDSDVLMGNIGELGQAKSPEAYGSARKRLASLSGVNNAAEETRLKAARNYGGKLYTAPTMQPATAHQHFGYIIVSCEKADLRPTASGVEIFADSAQHLDSLSPPLVPRSEVIDELCAAALHGQAPTHSGEWARATTEVCLALIDAAGSGPPRGLRYQVALPGT
jgi:phthalate 4,5-cis-dihydrodiol dehydrogenase